MSAGAEAQIDYIAGELSRLEQRMENQITPREFGRLEHEVATLTRDVAKLTEALAKQGEMLTAIRDQLAESKGGLKVLLAVGSLSGVVGAAIAKAAMWFANYGPKA